MPQKRPFSQLPGGLDALTGGVSKAARLLVSLPPNHPAGVAHDQEGVVVWTEFARHKVHCTVGPIAFEHPRGVAVRGKQCAVTGANGLVIYDLQTGEVERTFPQIRGAPDVAFTPDGRGVYVTGNNALALVNLADGTCTTLGGKLLETRGVAVSADGLFAFVSLGLSNFHQLQVVMVDLKNGKVAWPFKKCRGIGAVTGISLSGNYLYVVGPDCREVCRVDLRVPGERVTVYEATHGFYGVAVSPYGTRVVVTKWGADGRVIEIDVAPEPGHQPGHEAAGDAGSSVAPASGSVPAPVAAPGPEPVAGTVAAPALGAAPVAGPGAGPVTGPAVGPVVAVGAGPDADAARAAAALLSFQLEVADREFWVAVELEQLASDSYGVGSRLHTKAKERMQLAEAWVKELLPKFPRPRSWTCGVDGDCP
jgi:hypothetical protein